MRPLIQPLLFWRGDTSKCPDEVKSKAQPSTVLPDGGECQRSSTNEQSAQSCGNGVAAGTRERDQAWAINGPQRPNERTEERTVTNVSHGAVGAASHLSNAMTGGVQLHMW